MNQHSFFAIVRQVVAGVTMLAAGHTLLACAPAEDSTPSEESAVTEGELKTSARKDALAVVDDFIATEVTPKTGYKVDYVVVRRFGDLAAADISGPEFQGATLVLRRDAGTWTILNKANWGSGVYCETPKAYGIPLDVWSQRLYPYGPRCE